MLPANVEELEVTFKRHSAGQHLAKPIRVVPNSKLRVQSIHTSYSTKGEHRPDAERLQSKASKLNLQHQVTHPSNTWSLQ
jgi:hypothetical protein